jgi:proline iminopeptidase
MPSASLRPLLALAVALALTLAPPAATAAAQGGTQAGAPPAAAPRHPEGNHAADGHAHARSAGSTGPRGMPEELLARPLPLRSGIGLVHEAAGATAAEAQRYYDQGLAYLHSYAFIEAARSFHQALRLDSTLVLAHVALGRARLGMEDAAGAGAALARARAVASPGDARAQRRIRVLETQLAALAAPADGGRLVAYRQAIEEALAHELDNPELWTLRGNAEEALTGAAGIGQFGGAAGIAFYERALRLQPDHAGAHHYLIHSYETIGRTDSALAHGATYARLVPGIAHAQHMYAHDLMRVDRVPEAIALFERADSLERAYYATERVAPDLDWHRPHNLELLALLYLHEGRVGDAERVLREVRTLKPLGGYAYAFQRTLPEVLLVRGRAAEAERLLAPLLADGAAGPQAVARALLGRARLQQGDAAGARVALTAARAALAGAAPIEQMFFAPYADLLEGALTLAGGAPARADSLLRAAAAPANAFPGPDGWVTGLLAYDGAMDAAQRAGDWALLARLARAAVAYAPRHGMGHYHRALAAGRLGDRATEREALGRALALWQGADRDLPERREAERRLRALPADSAGRTGWVTGAGGARLFYRVEGTGTDTIVVLHGGPGASHQYMRAHLKPLAARHVVVYFDQRGGGLSTLYADSARLAFTHFVSDLEAVRRHFRLGRMTLLGHSWGGLLAPLYALAHPGRVERLVLVAPMAPARNPFLDEGHREIGRRIAERLDSATRARVDSLQRAMATTDDPAAVCRAVGLIVARALITTPGVLDSIDPADFCAGAPEAIRGAAATEQIHERALGAYDIRPRAQPLQRIPTLIVGGADDPYRTSSEAWRPVLPAARLVMLADSGHNPQVERPQEFHRVVAAFLDRGTSAPVTSHP